MFREMRRKNQMLSTQTCVEILKDSTSGVLAVLGDNGYPYTVPISYVYEDGRIYFHSATSGHKLDALKQQNKVSFCVIAKDQVVPEEYTSYYQSVVAFGKIRMLEDGPEKQAAAQKLALKYAPADTPQNRADVIEKAWKAFCMLELSIEHLTGKVAKELVHP